MSSSIEIGAENTWPSQEEANAYLRKHHLPELFENMTAQLIYRRPKNPKEFLIEHIRNMQMTKSDFPGLLDESNVEAMVTVLDPTNRGFISVAQYTLALKTLGVTDEAKLQPTANSVGASGMVSVKTFVQDAKAALKLESPASTPPGKSTK